ncbi:DUF3299 domain-containing protein [Roseobacter sp. A03A-229]
MSVTRRRLITTAAALAALPRAGQAATPRQVAWDDLIPPGVPYSEIIADGDIDLENDTWRPIFDENATKLNADLDGAYIRMPGYIIPLDLGAAGVTRFILVPYVGACIHVPPPPANQLVVVETAAPWVGSGLWDAVWVTGQMRHALQSTELAEIGYEMTADHIELFEW